MNGFAVMAIHNAAAALLLAVVVWCVTRIVRRPAVAHVLWLLVLLRMLAPPVFGVDYAALPAESPAPAPSLSSPTAADAVMPHDGRVSAMWRWWLKYRGRSKSTTETDQQAGAAVIAETSSAPAAALDLVAQCLPLAWAGITAILALVVLRRVLHMQRLLSQLSPAPPALQHITAQIADRLRLARAPQVRLSQSAAGPFVWSVGRQAVVVVPESFPAALSADQLAMILAHELAHLRRRDHWVRWIELWAVLACWWNPLLYWARRRLHEAEEACCDAWVAWLYPDQHRTYADALLRAAELAGRAGSPAPLLISPLFRVHPLKARIAMIVQGRTLHRNSRGTVLALVALALVVLPSYVRLTAADDDAVEPAVQLGKTIQRDEAQPSVADKSQLKPVRSEEHPGRLNVTVQVEEEKTTREGLRELTFALRKPVEGVTIAAFLGYVDDDGNAVTVSGKTGADGAVSIPVPYGHLQVMPPMLPAGYWVDFLTDNPEQYLTITTSPDSPVYKGAFIVRRGSVWNIRAIDADSGEPVGMLQCDVSPVEHHQLNRSGPTVLDARGVGQFTPPATSGKFRLSLFGPADGTQIRDRMQYRHISEPELTFDEGFDPAQIEAVSIRQDSDDVKLVDRNGKSATLRGATVTLKERSAVIDVKVRRWAPSTEVGRAVGTVVDPDGRPVAGAIVQVWLQTGDAGRAWTGHRTRTDSAGRFEFDRLSLRSTTGLNGTRLVAIASFTGFTPTASQPVELPARAGETVDAGKVTLVRGHEVQVRVIDILGGPAVGAIVSSAEIHQPTARNVTNQEGEIIIRDLPAGKVRLVAAYGHERGTIEIQVPEGDTDEVVATLRLQPELDLAAEPRHGGPLPAAQPAPALQIAAWTDGQARSLENLRGRVVVLYFWDRKEEACDQELAIIDNLRQRFTDDGVVFLGIHAAGSTVDEVRAFMTEKDWRMPTGLDQAGDAGRSLTMGAYGVGPSSFVVIASNGYIAFNRDAVMNDDAGERLYKQAAQALNINLEEEAEPEPESEEEGCDKCMQILEYIQRRAIENALGK